MPFNSHYWRIGEHEVWNRLIDMSTLYNNRIGLRNVYCVYCPLNAVSGRSVGRTFTYLTFERRASPAVAPGGIFLKINNFKIEYYNL